MSLDLQDRRVLITGATGLIGSAVARRLLAEGARVRAAGRDVARAEALGALGAEVVQADMLDLSALQRSVAGCDYVVHCAGVLAGGNETWAQFRRVNVDGSRALALAALDAGVARFLHVSTAWVYGLDAEPDTHEDSPLRLSRDPYTDTKLESEQVIRALVAERRLPAVIVQPTEVYGPGDRHWTLSAIRLLESGRMILPAGGKGVIQPIFIDDVAEGAVLALRHGRVGEAYLLTGTEVVSVREFFGCLASIVGRRRVPSVPRWLALAGAFLAESGARLTGTAPIFTRSAVRGTTMKATYLSGQDSKAYRELGFMPRVGLAEGMSAVQAWLAAQ